MIFYIRYRLSVFFIKLGVDLCPERGCRNILKGHIVMAGKAIEDTLSET
jgi:hypothetical protein